MKKHLLCLVATCSWLVPAAVLGQIHFTTAIDSAQEVPAPVGAVPGKGTGSFSLNEARTELTYRVTVTGLSGSGNIAAAHFHNGPPGVAAGVVRAISFVGNTASGVWKNTDTQALTDSMVQQLLRGRIYVNIHTATNPGGEIRGQVNLSTGVGFTAQLDSAQEVPAPTGAVPGRGTGSFTLNDARTELTYTITFHGLSGNLSAAHFHNGPPGVAAGVVRAISFVGNTATGVWRNTDTQALTDSMVSQLLKGRIYVNLHTAANPGGEIRGQVGFGGGIVTSVGSIPDVVPASFTLMQNYPNPFNPETVIPFTVSERSLITIKVFDLLGQEVQTLLNETLSSGAYTVRFNGAGIASGVYFYRLTGSQGFSAMRKMIVVK